jgi:signal transduction histidine kinase
LVLAVGFSVLGFSGYLPVARFGLLSSFAVITALLGDLFILPASLILFRPLESKKKDLSSILESGEEIEPLPTWLTQGSKAPHIYLRVALNLILVLFVISFSVLEVISVPVKPILATALVQFLLSGVYYLLARREKLTTLITTLALVVDMMMLSALIHLFGVVELNPLLLVYAIVIVYGGLVLNVGGGLLIAASALFGYLGAVHWSAVAVPAVHLWLIGGSMVFVGYGSGFFGMKFKERSTELAEAYRELRKTKAQLHDYAKDLEKKVEEKTRQLIHVQKMAVVGQMAAKVAHDLRNPYAAFDAVHNLFQGVVERIRPWVQAPWRKVFEDLEEDVELQKAPLKMMSDVVKGLHSLSRSSDTMEPVDVVAGLETVLAMLQPQWSGKIHVVKEYQPVPLIWGRSGELSSTWMNLVANAAQAIGVEDGGGGEIRVAVRQEGEKLLVKIRDSGCGIAAGHLDKIFDSGFTTKGEGEGSGLGLSICKETVERHGGTITVESELKKGTEFVVTLPVRLEPGDKD